MKNVFLYQNILEHNVIPEIHGLYRIYEGDLIGMDIDIIKNIDRKDIVSALSLREFFIIQKWFKYIIVNADKFNIKITKIKLTGETDYQIKVDKLLSEEKHNEIIDLVEKINFDGEHDFYSLTFFHKGQYFSLTSKGVLTTYADDIKFKELISNNEIWYLMVGKQNYVRN